MRRRIIYVGMFILGLLASLMVYAAAPQSQEVVVYKSATCGCCGKWVEHLKTNGFKVTVHDVDDMLPYVEKYGVPEDMLSCHTAVVDGYTIEGHVPAADIQRLLKERPKAKGLAVPGMPMGSPGMEGPEKQAYSVMLFTEDGKSSVYHRYDGGAPSRPDLN